MNKASVGMQGWLKTLAATECFSHFLIYTNTAIRTAFLHPMQPFIVWANFVKLGKTGPTAVLGLSTREGGIMLRTTPIA